MTERKWDCQQKWFDGVNLLGTLMFTAVEEISSESSNNHTGQHDVTHRRQTALLLTMAALHGGTPCITTLHAASQHASVHKAKVHLSVCGTLSPAKDPPPLIAHTLIISKYSARDTLQNEAFAFLFSWVGSYV